MQATLDASALKPFTKALTCLSRYGEDLAIYATPESLSLSTTNSSKSAYCRFKYARQFFSKYSVGTKDAWADVDDDEDSQAVTGQLLTKSLLSILRHKTVEKSVERCELSIVEGDHTEEDQDGLESKLIVRLHCKHGVVKTHRLLLLTLTSFLAPGVPDSTNESHLTVGPRTVKDMLEQFPANARSDPQLLWNFAESDVQVKTFESSLDAKGRSELSTELTISVDEFDLYDVYSTPTTIAFHLREFNATIAFAESMSLALDLRFTDPAAPLFIDVEGDNADTLFVISTSQVPGAHVPSQAPSNNANNPKKRDREETPRDNTRIKKSVKVVQRTDPTTMAQAARSQSAPASARAASLMPPPPVPSRAQASQREPEPLFLPASSQMSAADEQVLRETGLGVEDMTAEELAMMLEGEGEELALDEMEDVTFGATQSSDDQKFQPLFED